MKLLCHLAWMVVVLASAGCGKVQPSECPVCNAALAGDSQSVERLLAESPSPAERVSAADQAMYRMSSSPYPSDAQAAEIAALLLKAGANPHQDRIFRTTGRRRAYVLEDFIGVGRPGVVQAFIDAGFDVKGEPGAWALLRAAQASSNDCASALMAAGADPGRRLLETTALDEARKANDQEMVTILERRP